MQKILNPACAFPTQNYVKNSKNRVFFKNSENSEKIQFFDALTIFKALELDSPAQIEKKWILSSGGQFSPKMCAYPYKRPIITFHHVSSENRDFQTRGPK